MISVLIAACNSGTWLQRTVASVQECLDGDSHEIIVVDDCSTDGCCDKLSSQVRYTHNNQRLGCSGCRSAAAAQARGDVLLFTDPHCVFPRGSIQRLASAAVSTFGMVQPILRMQKRKRSIIVRGGVLALSSPYGLTIGRVNRSQAHRYPMLFNGISAMSRNTYNVLAGHGRLPILPGLWTWFELFYSTLVYRLGMHIRVVETEPCTHVCMNSRKHLPYTLPNDVRIRNAHWYYASCLPESYDRVFRSLLLSEFPGVNPTEDLRSQQFIQLRDWVRCNAVRSERWFLHKAARVVDLEATSKRRGLLRDN